MMDDTNVSKVGREERFGEDRKNRLWLLSIYENGDISYMIDIDIKYIM